MPRPLHHNPTVPPLPDWHALTASAVVEQLNTTPTAGLARLELTERLKKWGRNELTASAPTPLWKKLLRQFNQLIIWLLLGGATLSGILGEWLDAIAIYSIVVLNGILGFFQEERAETSIAALKRLAAPHARVLRDGEIQSVHTATLVPGDIVELDAGDFVPADTRLLKSFALSANEASLTGESLPVEKSADALPSALATLPDRANMCFMGTSITSGKATGVIVATGMRTALGQVAASLDEEKKERTPLQKKLDELGSHLLIICLAIVALIFYLRWLHGGDLVEILLFSISLMVAAVPEGLPAVVTIALALGLHRMAKRNAIIRHLPSVETLGCVSVICSDKTGTLTRNEMTVREMVVGGQVLHVSGSGYEPHGDFRDAMTGAPVAIAEKPELGLALKIGLLCSHTSLHPPDADHPTYYVIGDPTEGALVVAAHKAGVATAPSPIVDELPFDAKRRRMSVCISESDGTLLLLSKGAVEAILDTCSQELVDNLPVPLSQPRRDEILSTADAMSRRSLRVLGLAYNKTTSSTVKEEQLIFVGLVGMMDPPREEAREAIRKCQSAGIRPIVITGDHPQTALAVSTELGIVPTGSPVVTGDEIAAANDDRLEELLHSVQVFARVAPEHKLRIVNILKRMGAIVAMTGDGINDAPAVRAADIGIAMGITGTDVTKGASDMILTDDNFNSIVNAIEEGRGIYDNIQKFIHYLLSCNMSEVILIFIAVVLGWPPPLLAIQILWINLMTDGPSALALAMEAPEPGIMQRPPRPAQEPMFTKSRTMRVLVQGMFIASISLTTFWVVGKDQMAAQDVSRAQAVTFAVVLYAQLFFAYACRSNSITVYRLGFWSNRFLAWSTLGSIGVQTVVLLIPFTQKILLGTTIPLATDLPWILALAMLPSVVMEGSKAWFSASEKRRSRSSQA